MPLTYILIHWKTSEVNFLDNMHSLKGEPIKIGIDGLSSTFQIGMIKGDTWIQTGQPIEVESLHREDGIDYYVFQPALIDSHTTLAMIQKVGRKRVAVTPLFSGPEHTGARFETVFYYREEQ